MSSVSDVQSAKEVVGLSRTVRSPRNWGSLSYEPESVGETSKTLSASSVHLVADKNFSTSEGMFGGLISSTSPAMQLADHVSEQASLLWKASNLLQILRRRKLDFDFAHILKPIFRRHATVFDDLGPPNVGCPFGFRRQVSTWAVQQTDSWRRHMTCGYLLEVARRWYELVKTLDQSV